MIDQRQNNTDIKPESKTFFNKINGLKFKTGKIIKIIDFNKIVYCQADSNYCYIFTNEKSYFISKTLKWVVSQLPESMFKRVHQKFVVNMNYIIGFNHNTDVLELDNDVTIKVSRRKKKFVREIF